VKITKTPLFATFKRIFQDLGPGAVQRAIQEAGPKIREQARIEMAQEIGRAMTGDFNLQSMVPQSYPATQGSPHPLYGYDFANWFATPYSPRRRPDSLIDVQTIRRFADTYDIARSCINHLKREVQAQKFAIVAKDTKDTSRRTKSDIEDAYTFFTKDGGLGEKNEGRRHYELKMFEDVLVLGCYASYYELSRSSDILRVLNIDAATIRPRMDYYGWPGPGEDWYEQWIQGLMVGAFKPEEIEYDGTWPTSNSPWFKSPIEWLLGSILSALKADEWNRAWLTDGTQPGQTITLPEGEAWTPQACKDYVEWLTAMMSGDAKARQKMVFLPKGAQTKDNSRKDQDFSDFELWLAKRTGAVYGVSLASIGFEGSQYKVSQEGSQNQTSQFGAGALLDLRKEHYDGILAKLGFNHLEILNGETAEEKPIEKAQRLFIATGNVGWMSPSQASQEMGGEAVEGADEIMVLNTFQPLSQAMAPPPVVVDLPIPTDPTKQAPGQQAAAHPGNSKTTAHKAAAKADIKRWQTKAVKRIKDGRSPSCTFESEYLSPSTIDMLTRILGGCDSLEMVSRAFKLAEDQIDSGDDDSDDQAKKKEKQRHLVVLLLNTVDGAPSAFGNAISNLETQNLSVKGFADQVIEGLTPLHIKAATLGRVRATGGTMPALPSDADIALGTRVADSQRIYLEKMATQILAEELSDKQVADRMKLYGQRTVGTANESWKGNVADTTLINWIDTGDKSECEDCHVLADNGPYTTDTLPSVPGDGATECQVQCRCYLETEGGERSFYDPVDEMP